MTDMAFEKVAATVDASGLECPLPILKAKKALSNLEPGEVLEVITTDRKAKQDFDAFCRQTGNPLLEHRDVGEKVHHFLRRRT
jgi:tRNA 2-thiouridine synthesizing protein A